VIKLINIRGFEKVLELIEEEIENIEKLKQDLSLNSVFYLDKLDKFDIEDSLIYLEKLKKFLEKEKLELSK